MKGTVSTIVHLLPLLVLCLYSILVFEVARFVEQRLSLILKGKMSTISMLNTMVISYIWRKFTKSIHESELPAFTRLFNLNNTQLQKISQAQSTRCQNLADIKLIRTCLRIYMCDGYCKY